MYKLKQVAILDAEYVTITAVSNDYADEQQTVTIRVAFEKVFELLKKSNDLFVDVDYEEYDCEYGKYVNYTYKLCVPHEKFKFVESLRDNLK